MTDNNTKPSFASFGKSFQEKVLQALIVDKLWAVQFLEVFNVDECLDQAYLKLVANKYIEHYRVYKEFPTTDLLTTILKDGLSSDKDIFLREQCGLFLKRVITNQDLGDLPYVKEKAFHFCRQQLLKKALGDCVDIILTDKYEAAVDIIKNAVSAGMGTSPGLDYNNDIDARYSETYRNCVRTGIPELDDRKILNGGLGSGEIGIVVSATGVGKSHCLIHFGAQALLQGKNVFYYTMELNERYTGIRFDSHLTDIPSLECFDSKDMIKDWFDGHKDILGRLIIKQYPARTITVNTMKAHIDKMSYKGIKPDLVVVDYAGIIRSTEKYELPRLEMQHVIQELRGFANDVQVPVWTALQSNKEGAKAEIVDTTNMAESYGQAGEADFVLGLQRLSTQKSTGLGNIFIAKNRFGIDGVQYKIHLDTGRSKLRILSQDEVEQTNNDLEYEKEQVKDNVMKSLKDHIRKQKEKFSGI